MRTKSQWPAIFIILAIICGLIALVLVIARQVSACEPVKIKPTIEFCDVWFWRTMNPTAEMDFRRGDTIYVTNDSGRVCGRGLVKSAFPYVGAMVHVYGDEPMTLIKDGPRPGDILFLRWSRLPDCGILPTIDPVRYLHWQSVRVSPVLPED